MFNDDRKFISVVFENLDPSIFDKIIAIRVNECYRGIKMNMNNFSLENLLTRFREWMEVNNLKLSEFDEEGCIKWLCETNMGKNYNEICAKSFKKVLEEFGIIANVESFNDEYFELSFLKK